MGGARRMCLYLPHLATDRVRREEPGLDGGPPRPLALVRPVGGALVLAAIDPLARALGLQPGLSLGEAQARAPELVSRPDDPGRDRAALQRLANWAVRFSPLVEAVEPDTLVVDVTGCPALFGGEENLARQAVAGLAGQGFSARAVIADTVGAAFAVASAGREDVQVVPVGEVQTALAGLPPAALRIEERATQRLAAVGVRSIGELLALPRRELPARFGPQLVLRMQQALGEVFEGVAARTPEDVPQVRMVFEGELREFTILASLAEHLLGELLERLAAQSVALRAMDCLLYHERQAPTRLALGLSRPSRSARHIGGLLRQRLEQVDVQVGVTALVLVALETARWHPPQQDLFELDTPEQEAFDGLIDRLAARLGCEAVLGAELVDDHEPERAYRLKPVADLEGGGSGPGKPERQGESGTEGPRPPAGARPIRLFSPPVRIRVVSLVPDGPPTWFAFGGREYVVAAAQGPERIETGWWRGADVRRDYFRVMSEEGEQFWIYRSATDGAWYLHGLFG